jgi:hypothetical protein
MKRPRFTVWHLMLAVALVGLSAGGLELVRRSRSPAHRLRSLPVSIRVDPDWKSPPGLAAELAGLIADAHLVPDQRLGHFCWLTSNPHYSTRYSIHSWGGFIEGVESTPDGTMVLVRMTPAISTSGGTSACTADHLMERYLIANGQVHFVGATELEGLAGEPITD